MPILTCATTSAAWMSFYRLVSFKASTPPTNGHVAMYSDASSSSSSSSSDSERRERRRRQRKEKKRARTDRPKRAQRITFMVPRMSLRKFESDLAWSRVEASLNALPKTLCPTCRVPFRWASLREGDDTLKELLDELEVYCPLSAEGCESADAHGVYVWPDLRECEAWLRLEGISPSIKGSLCGVCLWEGNVHSYFVSLVGLSVCQ